MDIFPIIVSTVNVDGNMYFKTYNHPGTYVFNNQKRRMSYIPEENAPFDWHGYIYSDCVLYEKKILFNPNKDCDYFEIYDIETHSFTYLKNTNRYSSTKSVLYEKNIYLFEQPTNGGRAVKFNMEDMRYDEVSWKGDDVEPIFLFNNCCKIDASIWGPNYGRGNLCVFNFDEQTSKKIFIEYESFPIASVAFDGELFWLSGNCDEILLWESKGNRIVEQILLHNSDVECPWEMRFSSSLVHGDYIYFAPVKYKKIIRINIKNKEVEELFTIKNNEVCWNVCELDNGRLLFGLIDYNTNISRNVIIENDEQVYVDRIEFVINDTFLRLYLDRIIYEDNNSNLSDYLYCMKNNI